MALSLEAMALLMAIIPMRILLDDATAATIAVLSLTVACIGLAGFSRRPWIWKAGAVIQVALIACWFIHWSLGAAGIVFALVWAFCWQTRNQLAKPPRR
ncbi:DUF4233 domain-containing protein [Glycomyces buryatensis]|uniref:DUF4233 domain-containing protein n=2 Tax=Glycomyces buryatensis TaxID=2570927 RepID=A0A4S8QKS1_9ACTN|nr:DUF4233 domain-containing protein [Glycomyces buryatensis]